MARRQLYLRLGRFWTGTRANGFVHTSPEWSKAGKGGESGVVSTGRADQGLAVWLTSLKRKRRFRRRPSLALQACKLDDHFISPSPLTRSRILANAATFYWKGTYE